MQTYQEYLYFIERYRHTVFSFVAERLFSYIVYPLGRESNAQEREQRKPREYNMYDREDMKRYFVEVDGQRKMVVPDGPFEHVLYHIFVPKKTNPVVEDNKYGNSQFDNFCKIIEGVTDTQFPEFVEKFATRDCDCKNSKDCVDLLEIKLKAYWKLS